MTMKLSQVVLLIGMSVFFAVPVFAQDYSVIVLPDSLTNSNKTESVKTNYDKILADKIISEINVKSKSAAPKLNDIKPLVNTIDSKNLKTFADSYNAKKILVIKSSVETMKSSQQEVQKTPSVPMIVGMGMSKKMVTKAVLYDVNSNQIVWEDVFFKNLSFDLNPNDEKISEDVVQKYYEELSKKIIENIPLDKDIHKVSLFKKTNTKRRVTPVFANKNTEQKVSSKKNIAKPTKVSEDKQKIKKEQKEKLLEKKIDKTLSKLKLETRETDSIPGKTQLLIEEKNSDRIRFVNTSPRYKSRTYKLSFDETINEF